MPSDFKFLSGVASHCIDTLANWELHNPVIPEGVLCLEKSGIDTIKIKIGDGVKTYTQLSYFASGSSNVVLATGLVDGLLSSEDFVKLANIEEYANNYIHPSTHSANIITEDDTHRFVTDEEKAAWTAKQVALGFTPENLAKKNTANGYAGLDENGKLSDSVIPNSAITDTFEVTSEAAMLALSTARRGDICIRTDENKSYILSSDDYATLSAWKVLTHHDTGQTYSISRTSGTLLADTKTINLPWAYSLTEENVLVFLGSTYQHVDTLVYVDSTTIELTDAVDEDVPYEVIRTMALDNKTEIFGKYNYILNGNFDFWQRGDSQTLSGYYSDDRWANNNVGTTKVHSKQSFAVGELFPDGTPTPKFYSRTVVTSVAGAGNYCQKRMNIEFVSTLAGKKAILSFYAKADTNKKIGIQLVQVFGTGGSPSASTDVGVQYVDLTSTWKRFVLIFDIPVITNKTLGTDKNDTLRVNFWFDAGSTYTQLAELGQQSGTFDISNVVLLEGEKDISPIPRSYHEELYLCRAFYEEIIAHWVGDAVAATSYSIQVQLTVPKRAIPVLSSVQTGAANGNMGTRSASAVTTRGFAWTAAAATTGAARGFRDTIAVDAEI